MRKVELFPNVVEKSAAFYGPGSPQRTIDIKNLQAPSFLYACAWHLHA